MITSAAHDELLVAGNAFKLLYFCVVTAL